MYGLGKRQQRQVGRAMATLVERHNDPQQIADLSRLRVMLQERNEEIRDLKDQIERLQELNAKMRGIIRERVPEYGGVQEPPPGELYDGRAVVDVATAAAHIGKSVATAYRWCVDGKLDAIKTGSRWVVFLDHNGDVIVLGEDY